MQRKLIEVGGIYAAHPNYRISQYDSDRLKVEVLSIGEAAPFEGSGWEHYQATKARERRDVKVRVTHVYRTYGDKLLPLSKAYADHYLRENFPGGIRYLEPKHLTEPWEDFERSARETREWRERQERLDAERVVENAPRVARVAATLDALGIRDVWHPSLDEQRGTVSPGNLYLEDAERIADLYDALGVIVKDPAIRNYLAEHDPKALEQADRAFEPVVEEVS